MSKWHGGKGSAQRPTNTDKYATNWEARLPRNKGKITAKIGKHYFYMGK